MTDDEREADELARLAASEREAAIRSAVALHPFRRPDDVLAILSAGARTVGGVHHCSIGGELVPVARAVEGFAEARPESLAAPERGAATPKLSGTREERHAAIRQRFGLA